MDREDTAITLNEITSIDHLSYVLTELRNQESSDSALAYALDAQLQVLSIINSPKLSMKNSPVWYSFLMHGYIGKKILGTNKVLRF